jgi:putative hydrolase of the HAD superfamily
MENSFIKNSNKLACGRVARTTSNIKGIFFDAGNTLLSVYPSVGSIYAQAAEAFGLNVTHDAIEESFKELWTQTAPLVSNEGHRLTYEKEKDWWKYLVREVFREHLHLMDFDQFFDYLYQRFAETDCWRLYEDVPVVLDELKQRGLKLAIISNWDSRLPALCDQLGISPFFEALVVSALVGYEKPHPTIFQIALEQTGLTPEEVLYIGDDPYLDYQAARKIGIHSLHLDRFDRFPDHPDRIVSLTDLMDRL